MSEIEVEVVAQDGRTVEFISPALGRLAVSRGVAEVVSTTPFVIMLAKGYSKCPKSFSDGKNIVNTVNPAQALQSIATYFKKADPEKDGDGMVWVQLVKANGNQVVFQKGSHKDGSIVRFPAVKGRDPVCLSQTASFDDIVRCTDLREFVRKGVLQLLTQAEADAYFEKKAAVFGEDPETLQEANKREAAKRMMDAEMSERMVQQVAQQSAQTAPADAIVDPINPRVQHLLHQVAPFLGPNERMPERELMQELFDMADSLSYEDYSLIFNRGYYQPVKNWAQAQLKALQDAK